MEPITTAALIGGASELGGGLLGGLFGSDKPSTQGTRPFAGFPGGGYGMGLASIIIALLEKQAQEEAGGQSLHNLYQSLGSLREYSDRTTPQVHDLAKQTYDLLGKTANAKQQGLEQSYGMTSPYGGEQYWNQFKGVFPEAPPPHQPGGGFSPQDFNITERDQRLLDKVPQANSSSRSNGGGGGGNFSGNSGNQIGQFLASLLTGGGR